MRKRTIELLAPAGSKEAFISAVQNGADAVYIGGNLYNARMNANNFDDNTMQAAVDYAHKRGVKVFVTMNTLLKDDELKNALSYASFLYEAGVDALIIQDLGFGNLVRHHLPDFEIHLSTQANTYDKYAVRVAKRLGYKRVVLARELSLNEIKEICEDKGADIEVFVHGAVCICYSGECQLSRSYGGRSANRGRCAQPCRLLYEVDDDSSKRYYSLSPKDMCQIDNLGELIDAGVISFKIEGRMKLPEYVGVVTSIYRKYIDKYLEFGEYEVSDEDRNALLQIFNRGDFTEGYMHYDPGKEFMSDFIPKNKGIFVGRVSELTKNSRLVKISSNLDIKMHDGIEIRDRDGEIVSSSTITYCEKLGRNSFLIGDIKGRVKERELLYRTSSIEQLDMIRRTFRNIDIFSEEDIRDGRKLDINFICACYGGKLTLKAKTGKVNFSAKLEKNAVCDDTPTPIDRYRQSLLKTGNTPFRVAGIDFRGDFDIRVKTSEINELRRSCLKGLEAELCKRRKAVNLDLNEVFINQEDESEGYMHTDNIRLFYTLDEYRSYSDEKKQDELIPLLPLAELCATDSNIEGNYIPYISAVSKGLEDRIIEDNYDRAVEICISKGILVGNLGWLIRLSRENIEVYADYGLNAYNKEAIRVLKSLGVKGVLRSLECGDRDGQNYPLMISEHKFDESYLKSYSGHNIKIIRRPYSDQDIIVNNN